MGKSLKFYLSPEPFKYTEVCKGAALSSGNCAEIFPDDAKAGGAKVISTGRSDFPNQINNVLAFPGIFRGAFDVRASDINEEMKMAAAMALAALVPEEELNENNIMPQAFDPRVGPAVAKAVAEAARRTGVARI